MNRKEAEKLLAAFIFGDLDDASKTDLTAYLQGDDELRERLADMRMTVKVASDALQHGPNPVLSKRRLKQLARLASRRGRRSAVFTVRYMSAAAAILVAVLLPAFLLFMPSLNKVKKPSTAISMLGHKRLDSYAGRIENGDVGMMGGGMSGGGYNGGGGMTQMQSQMRAYQSSRQGQVDKLAELSDGRLAVTDGDADEIVGRGATSVGGAVAVDATLPGDVVELDYESRTNQWAADSSSATGKRGKDYGGGNGGGQCGLHVLRERSALVAKRPAPAFVGTPRPAQPAAPTTMKTPAPDRKFGSAGVAASLPMKPASSKNDAADKKFNVNLEANRSVSARDGGGLIVGAKEMARKARGRITKQQESREDEISLLLGSLEADLSEADKIKFHKNRELVKKELSDPAVRCELEARLVDVEKIGSINGDIISAVDKYEDMDTEIQNGLGVDLRERAEREGLEVANLSGPVGDEEIDLPAASRFKSVPVNPWVMAKRDSLSTFALDVDTASYTLCRRYIYGGFLPPAGAVRMEEFINYFNYHYPQRADRTFTVHAEAAASPFADKGKRLTLLKIGVKARTIGRDQYKAAHLILVVDTSASMGKPDRLGLVQEALNLLIDKLSAADRVTLITCSDQARLHMEATSLRHRDRIRRAINAIQPSGPTNLLAGLKLGYAVARRSFDAKGINHVVLCSDGVANVGQTEAEAILKAVAADRKQGITITCVGVGYGSYNDIFLESLANRGDGSYVFLDSVRQAQRVFVEQLAATLYTVAKDARIQVSFNPDRVRRYRLIGYENRDIEDKRFRDDTIDAGQVGSGQCSTALYELELTGQLSANQQEDLGTVFVRYRVAETDQMEEISCRLKSEIVQRRKVESSPRFFLAAAAAQFAEILRQSEHAQNGSLTDVLAVAEKVRLTLPLDRDVRELVELIRKAEHLPKSQ